MDQTHASLPVDSLLRLCDRICCAAGTPPVPGPGFTVYPWSDTQSFYRRIHIHDPAPAALALPDLPAAFFGAEGLPVSCLESDGSPALLALLEGAGYTLSRVQTGMILSLQEFQPRPADSHVVELPADRLQEWSDTCRDAFGKPDELPAFTALQDTCRFFAYELDGKPVATAMFQPIDHRVCSVHEIGTFPEYRGRGIASALLNRIFAEAKAAGCAAVGLQASEAGRPVYERLGFRAVHRLCTYRPAH